MLIRAPFHFDILHELIFVLQTELLILDFPKPPTKLHSHISVLGWSIGLAWKQTRLIVITQQVVLKGERGETSYVKSGRQQDAWIRFIDRNLHVHHEEEGSGLKMTNEASIGIWQHGMGSLWSILK